MLIRVGVEIGRLNRDIRRTLNHVSEWVAGLGEELIVTSTFEGTHMPGSLHYSDDAYDFRGPKKRDGAAVDKLKGRLGPDFDLIEYDTIMHIEYDPKS